MIFAAVLVMPLIMVVRRLAEEVAILEFTNVVVADIPLVILVMVLAEDDKVFEFTKLVVVVEITPFTLLVNTKALEVVAIDMTFAMVVVGIIAVEVIPFTVEVNT